MSSFDHTGRYSTSKLVVVQQKDHSLPHLYNVVFRFANLLLVDCVPYAPQLKENTAEMFGIELASEYEYKFSSTKVSVKEHERFL